MKKRAMLSASATMLAVVITFVTAFITAPAELRAQCNSIEVTNNSDCSFTICAGTPSNPNCRTIPADTTVFISFPSNLPPSGVFNSCGQFITFPGNGCIEQIPIGTGCCVRICFNRVNCTITVTKVANHCTC